MNPRQYYPPWPVCLVRFCRGNVSRCCVSSEGSVSWSIGVLWMIGEKMRAIFFLTKPARFARLLLDAYLEAKELTLTLEAPLCVVSPGSTQSKAGRLQQNESLIWARTSCSKQVIQVSTRRLNRRR